MKFLCLGSPARSDRAGVSRKSSKLVWSRRLGVELQSAFNLEAEARLEPQKISNLASSSHATSRLVPFLPTRTMHNLRGLPSDKGIACGEFYEAEKACFFSVIHEKQAS